MFLNYFILETSVKLGQNLSSIISCFLLSKHSISINIAKRFVKKGQNSKTYEKQEQKTKLIKNTKTNTIKEKSHKTNLTHTNPRTSIQK